MVSFRFSEAYRTKNPDVQQRWVQTLLRAKGWIVPNYELAPGLQDIQILRVVVRENVSAVLVDRLVADLVSNIFELFVSETERHNMTGRDRGRLGVARVPCACSQRAPVSSHYRGSPRQAREGCWQKADRHLRQAVLKHQLGSNTARPKTARAQRTVYSLTPELSREQRNM